MGDKKHSKEYRKEPGLDKAPRTFSQDPTYLFLEPHKTVPLYRDKLSPHRSVEGMSYPNLTNYDMRLFYAKAWPERGLAIGRLKAPTPRADEMCTYTHIVPGVADFSYIDFQILIYITLTLFPEKPQFIETFSSLSSSN